MNDLAMKREGAFIIDHVILSFFAGMASIKHSDLKTLFCCIRPISFIYYILKNEMIYDKFSKISVGSQAEK